MEERRLKNILSHLSLCSSSPSENSAVVSVISKAEVLERREKSHVLPPYNTSWSPRLLVEEQNPHRSIAKSRSSSNIFESSQSGFVEETLVSGAWLHPTTPSSQAEDAQVKAAAQSKKTDFLSTSFKQFTGNPALKERASHIVIPHSDITTRKCGCLLQSKTLSSEVEGDAACMQMNDRGVTLRSNLKGYGLKTTGFTPRELGQVQRSISSQFEHVCSLSDSKYFRVDAHCQAFSSGKALVDGFQTGEANQKLGITDARKVFGAQTQRVIDSERRAKCTYDKDVGAEHQTNTEAPDVLQNSLEQNLISCRDMHMLDSQPGEVGIDSSGSMNLSRNNVMTGQRRRIIDDCIFCLIIQGQSPAFKLYEDEMCVCILDVHPLTHGHSLLIPKAHFPSLELTPPEVAAAMCATVPFISMAVMQATNCDSFNLLVNSGTAAGQVVFHTHFHIIPRRPGDNLWRSEDCSRRALPVGHETALLVQQIRHNLSK